MLIGFVAASLLLAACGDDDDSTTTVTEPGVSEEGTAATGAETTAASGPSGELTSSGVGEVTQGMSLAEIEAIFGPANRTQKSAGCELDPKATGSTAATYEIEHGRNLIFVLEDPSGGMVSYRNTSPSLTTEKGDVVGDSFESLQANWGDELQPLNIGSAQANAKTGIYEVKDGETTLTFEIFKGKIGAISGGTIQICD